MVPGRLPPRKIAFRMICCLHNSPAENCPQEHCPKDKLHTIFFLQESEMVVLKLLKKEEQVRNKLSMEY